MKRAGLLIATVASLLAVAIPSWAAVEKKSGDVIAAFNGGIHPTALPRHTLAPVAVSVGGGIRSATGRADQLPQMRRITVAINRQGRLFDRGLPVCRVRRIQPATQKAAHHICGDSIIGSGNVLVQVRIPSQTPFLVPARVLVFNGPRRSGRKLIWAQVYARKPPGAFVLSFEVRDGSGVRPTVLTTTLPARTRAWAYLLHFEMTLHRTYLYRGERRTFVSAACSAPEGFNTAPFTFARVTYGFANAPSISLSQSGICSVAE